MAAPVRVVEAAVRAIVGIDAAWTERQPTGVAVLHVEGESARIAAVAPSYASFVACCEGARVDWRASRFDGGWPALGDVLAAARKVTGASVSVVAVDMPLATVPCQGRRAADTEISRAFGARGCGAHSPSTVRPGALGASLMDQLVAHGFPLATCSTTAAGAPCSIEVYPHPALLGLLGRSYRIPYKVSRSGKYWKGASVRERISNLLHELGQIHAALTAELGQVPIDLPSSDDVRTLAELKRYEDALDALVCAWIGLRFAQGAADPYGDATAAIWVPRPAGR